MLKNYFKIALRNLRVKKAFSFINITGLAIGMAGAILILLWVQILPLLVLMMLVILMACETSCTGTKSSISAKVMMMVMLSHGFDRIGSRFHSPFSASCHGRSRLP